jgi:hypothetical protein
MEGYTMMNKLKIFGAVAVGALTASASFAAEQTAGVNAGGFVDAGYGWVHVKDAKLGNGGTFRFNEGAIWLSGASGSTKAVLDLPVTPSPDGSNTLALGWYKAQAFVEAKYDNGFAWKLGQFDSLFGSEGKYTYSIPFTTHSNITQTFFPWVHTGLVASYWIDSDWALDLLLANQAGMAQTMNGKLEYGVKLGGKLPAAYLTEISGSLYTKAAIKGFIQASGVLEFTFGDLVLRGDGIFQKPKESGKTILAIGGYALYNVDEMLSAGVRVGTEKGTNEKFEATVGPQFKLSKNLTAKVDYTFKKGNPTGTTHLAALTGVYKF